MDHQARFDEPDPATLAERIGRGDRQAEEALARHFGPRIEFMLRRRLRDPSLAADLRQETLVIVIERLRESGLESPDKLPAFIHRTALNLALGEARRFHRRNTHNDETALADAAAAEPLITERIDRERLARMVRRLLRELKQPRDRQLLRRFYLTEESKQSICASLEVTPEHFDRVLYRARKRFRELVERELGDILGR